MSVRLIFVYLCIFSNILYTTHAQVIDFGQPCTINGDTCRGENIACTGGTCKCVSRYFRNGNACIPRSSGCSTTVSDSCKSPAATCKSPGGLCTCNTGYYDDNGNSSDGTCRIKIELGQSGCSKSVSDSCKSPGATCQSHGGSCTCNTGYYDDNGNTNGGTCRIKIELGSSGCSTSDSDSCKSPYATCRSHGGSCTCNTGYYDDNGNNNGGTCRIKIELGSSECLTVVSDSCKSPDATCRSYRGSCTCNNGYYDDNGNSNGGTCRIRKNLGKQCTNLPNECATSNTECLDNKCTCSSNFYDTNGFNDDGSCASVAELRVKSISFSEITTSGFTVSWIPPSSTSQINNYEIIWSLKTTDSSLNGGNSVVPKSSTSFTISTGVTAGKTYTINVKSVNTDTRKDYPRSISLSKEQASKPNKPRSLTTSDLDAKDKSITVEWSAPSNGVASYYRIQLFDDKSLLTSKDQSSTTANLYYQNMKNGYRYDVKISARSEEYESSLYEWGEFYSEQITTTVQTPSAPRNVTCDVIKEESITLKWLKPLSPNGDIVRYNIEVISNTDDHLFSTSTDGVVESHQVLNLSSDNAYRFLVYTQNVMYNSSEFGISQSCTTKSKLSDPPNDFQETEVTSRNISIRWREPIKAYSENIFGYVIQLKEKSTCVEEVVYKCLLSSCPSSFEPSELEHMCDISKRKVISVSESQLSGLQSYTFSNIMPDTTYNVIGAAVTSLGTGNTADITITTGEEAPQRPYHVLIKDIKTTSFTVTWDIAEPRPGKTNYTVTLTADSPAESKAFIGTGFTCRTYNAIGLEEYWFYSVLVTAITSKGSISSYKTGKYRTLQTAPGKVSNSVAITNPGGNYSRMKVSWQAPDILQHNSVIKSYNFVYFPQQKPESAVGKTFDHQFSQDYHYEIVVDVVPEQSYTFEVFAINEQNVTGEKYIETKSAPARVSADNNDVKSESQTTTVIVGVVLGVIIIVLSIYALYATVVIRRYKQKTDEQEIAKHPNSKGPIYVNESFMTGVSEMGEQPNIGASNIQATSANLEPEYLRLDDSTREDKETYESIKCL